VGLTTSGFEGPPQLKRSVFCVGHQWSRSLRTSRMSIVGGLDVRHEALVFRMGV